jgi:hypothetical protein
MPTPARPPVKKAPAKKATAAVRARREVRSEKVAVPPVVVKLRGQVFEIPVDRLGSDRAFTLTNSMLDAEGGARLRAMGRLVRTLVGPSNEERFTTLARDDEPAGTLVLEFMTELNKAGNVPN